MKAARRDPWDIAIPVRLNFGVRGAAGEPVCAILQIGFVPSRCFAQGRHLNLLPSLDISMPWTYRCNMSKKRQELDV